MKILVVGGTHGNEMLGITLVKLLQKNPLLGVDACIANPRAVRAGTRFVETDLNRSFGVRQPKSYEETRAQELLRLGSTYDVVLDFHNTETTNNNTCFAGEGRNPLLESVAVSFGLSSGIIATYDCINKYSSNTLSIEISVGDTWDDAKYWYEQISELTNKLCGGFVASEKVQWYKFLRRVTWAEQQGLELTNWKPFEPLSNRDKRLLGITDAEVCPIFIGSTLTEYYATLVSKQVYAC